MDQAMLPRKLFWGFLILMPDAFFRNVRYILILRTAVVNVWHYYIMYDWGFFKGRKCCKLLWLWLAFTNTYSAAPYIWRRRSTISEGTIKIASFPLLPFFFSFFGGSLLLSPQRKEERNVTWKIGHKYGNLLSVMGCRKTPWIFQETTRK